MRPARSLSWSIVALLAFLVQPLVASPVRAQVDDLDGDVMLRKIRPKPASAPFPRTGVSATTADPETIWVGYWSGANTANNYWKVGGVPASSGARPPQLTDGMWTFESDQHVHGDSLSGWWSIRNQHTNFSGATLIDEERPWWAVPYGNIANFKHNPGGGSDRTFGVTGVWHRDAGANAVQVLQPGLGGAAPQNPTWAPLEGSYSAWMGLRGHGDLTYQDPLTGNHFNADVVQFLGYNPFGGLASKLLPGYVGDMDQMLYRDVDLTGYGSGGLSVRFAFRTNMSTGKDTDPRYRTGWHEGDGLSQNVITPGNFISAEAAGLGAPNDEAPIDSFAVYVGVPVEGEWRTSLHPYDADGLLLSLGLINPVTGRRIVQDSQRRCFNEVLERDNRRWLFGVAGDNGATTITTALADAEVMALLDSAAALGHPNRLRLVFRVHTNRAFDDARGSVPGAYNSGYAGAAVVDDVVVSEPGGPVFLTSGFESTTDIDNDPAVGALNAWKSTGKPPAAYAHVHEVATLRYEDVCGPVGGALRLCNLEGLVVATGLHDMNEVSSDPNPTSTEHEGFWGIVSPTINLAGADQNSSDGTKNNMNLSASERWATTDYLAMVDAYYGGSFYIADGQTILTNGQIFQLGFQSYPAQQADGVEGWGEIAFPNYLFYGSNTCYEGGWGYWSGGFQDGVIRTSNASGYPDSLRIVARKLSECYRFGITTGCSGTEGLYFDNISLAIVDGAPNLLSLSSSFRDVFPANETPGLPGTAAFDTTSAHIKVGLRDVGGYLVPGDSLGVNAYGDSIRLDLLFRIMPGVGNYVAIGNRNSGLRGAPTNPVLHGPDHFWASYQDNPGTFSGPPGVVNPGLAVAMHLAAPSGWSEIVWNSARMDTAEQCALFPLQSAGIAPLPSPARWASTYHEQELLARPTLGIPRNRCFLTDTLHGVADTQTLTCGSPAMGPYPPEWLTLLPVDRTGWDGSTTTTEGTKIIPDGLLTPGAHVQYFVRRQDLVNPTSVFSMDPDTNEVLPAGHRWGNFGVLPDRWGDMAFGGVGMASTLFYTANNLNEWVWKGVTDSIGATRFEDIGNADGYGGAPAGADPAAYPISDKNRAMGTTWDFYQGTNIGARLGNRTPGTFMDDGAGNGKWTYCPPTPDMLATYYKVIVQVDFGWADTDMALLTDWLGSGEAQSPNRGFLMLGSSPYAEAFMEPFVANYLGVQLVDLLYDQYAQDRRRDVILRPGAPISTTDMYGMWNSCLWSRNVIDRNAALPETQVDLYYQTHTGQLLPAAVYKPHTVNRPWVAQTVAVDPWFMRGPFGSGYGRNVLMYNLLYGVFGTFAQITGTPESTLDTPQNNDGRVAFALGNNPLRSGHAEIRFALDGPDHVSVKLYDVGGRLVRTLADRQFKPGDHSLIWDGADNSGRRLARGVYFLKLTGKNTRMQYDRKIVLLK